LKKRIIIIGDLHGCLEEVQLLLDKIAYNTEHDRLIFVGDLVDRGPASAECVKFLREVGAETIRGNHDDKYIRFNKHTQKEKQSFNTGKKYKNPMVFNEKQMEIFHKLSEEDFIWLENAPNFIFLSESNLLAVHAGINPQFNPLEQSERTYRHCRYVDNTTKTMVSLDNNYQKPVNSSFWSLFYSGSVDIVYGHHVVSLKEPRIDYNNFSARTIGIDTGCCFNGYLTALIINPDGSEEYSQVASKHPYNEYVFFNR